jgi:hypothetical protein
MTPEPTPYDIISPPVLAFSPTWQVWIISILLFILAIILLFILKKLGVKKSAPLLSIEELFDRLSRFNSNIIDKNEITYILLFVKRFLSALENKDLTSFVATDLKKHEANLSQTSFKALTIISKLELLSYAKELDAEKIDASIQQLLQIFKEHRSSQGVR